MGDDKGFIASLMRYVPKSLTLTGNAALDGLIFKAIVAVASIAGTWLYTHLKLTDPDYATYLSGAIVAALVAGVTFVWGWLNSKFLQAHAMNAALNLQQAVMPSNVPTATPITPATAQTIVKQFGGSGNGGHT